MAAFNRIPALSRPLTRAAYWDAVGLGVQDGLFTPFVGVLARRLGGNAEMMALLAMAPFFGLLSSLRVARLSGSIGWGKLLGSARLICRLLLVLFVFISSPNSFVLLATLIIAISFSMHGVSGSLIRDHVRPLFQGDTIKWTRIAAVLVAVPLALQAGRTFDVDPSAYRQIFPAAGIIALATGLLLFYLPKRQSETSFQANVMPDTRHIFGILRQDRIFRTFLLVFFVGTFAEKIGMPLLPVYFADELNLSYRNVGSILGIAGPMASIVGYLFWGRIVRRTRKPLLVLALCMSVKALRPVLLVLAAYADSPVYLVATAEGLFRFVLAGLDISTMTCILGMAPREKVPHYAGLHFWFMGVRGIAGPFVGWAFLRSGMRLQWAFCIITGIVVIGAAGLWMMLLRGMTCCSPSKTAG